ncbi:ABC transporter permease [Candidatus Competibacter phosphatis]|uniref:ABC transporter permease n=1 Tax=Candidatus Competibacter phosphatis TaxID=221280 RepID=A0ABX1TNP3_9GAMM|nr:ABC transporter permease [Candidatus Competibacter phosphatis]NMQ19566.1 ABC transporter permease [Candidatus Competibacter phosphatis]
MNARGGALMRLRGMVRKESLQILRDPSSIAIAFVMPVVLLLLFGYGVSLDAQHIPLAMVIERPDANSASFAAAFQQSEYFSPRRFDSIQDAEQALRERQVDGIVWLRGDFSRRLLAAGDAPVGVILNGVDANQARIASGYIQGAWQSWLQAYASSHGQELTLPAAVEQRVWFNPALRSRNFLVPGLVAVIMTLIGALLTALVVAREWERGTMEALMVTPIRIGELLLGKLLPYFVLGMGGMLLSVAMARWQFGVPLAGSFWLLLATSTLFMLVALGMGLLISTVARNQFVAGQIAILVTFLPAFILSGFIFDIGSMPAPIQFITHVVPARYFVAILQTLFLAGDVWPVVLGNAAALLLMMLIFFAVLGRKARKRLE